MSDIPRQPAPEDEADLGTNPEDEVADEIEGNQAGDADGSPIEPEVDEDGNPIDEGEPSEEVLDDEPAPRRGGGGSRAVREQRARAQTAERQLAEERRERQEDRQRLQALEQRITQDPQAQARAEQEWLANLEMMTPAQQAQAIMQRGRQEFGTYLQQVEFRSNDRADKAAYDARARTDPIFKKYGPEVERVLAQERAAGRNPDREVILDVLYGRAMREQATRVAPAQRRAGAARVAAARTQPTGARSTVAPGSRRPAPGSIEADEAMVEAAIARGERVF